MPKPLEILGLNIAAARRAAGLTQKQLAEEVEATQGTVSAWESGGIDVPYTTLCQIAAALKTSPAALSDPSVPLVDSREARLGRAVAGLVSDDDALDAVLLSLEGSARAGRPAADKKRKPTAG